MDKTIALDSLLSGDAQRADGGEKRPDCEGQYSDHCRIAGES